MNKHHQYILAQIKKYEAPKKWEKINKYLGTPNYVYGLKSSQFGDIAKKWISENKNITEKDFVDLLDSLNNGKSVEEKIFVGTFLGRFPQFRKSLDLNYLEKWFGNVVGWVEVDTLCSFESEEVLERWREWKELLLRLNKDSNIQRRRASLVLLTRPVRKSSDNRLSELAFQLIDPLKGEKEILITKAVSWLLRALTKNHPKEVEVYLTENSETLPKIALRETWNKLKTGKK